MNIFQFLRIIWAYRLLITLVTLISLLAAVVTVQLVRPRYEAQSRVMLDIIKPDPVTGQVIATAFLRAFTKTQIELVKDPQTGRLVVEELGWAKDPVMQKTYRDRKQGRDLDFDRWAAQEIAKSADAKLIEGSNILEISYSSSSPEAAKRVADALRKAYIDTTLESRRSAARRNAEWYEDQAQKAKVVLFQAEADKAAFERANGIVLGPDKVDIDSARLAALAGQGGAPMIAPAAANSVAAVQLAQLDAELALAMKQLGPNHPQLQQLRQRREMLATQVVQERNAARAATASAMSAAQATSGMLEAQKAKVMAKREQVERLRLMQDGVDLRRDQYNKAVLRAAQLRQEAEIAEAGVIPLASAVTPQEPVFPKKGLIVGAAVPGGIGLGLVIALALELLSRRVRSVLDLANAVPGPVLAVIRNPKIDKVSVWARLLAATSRRRRLPHWVTSA